MDAVEDAVDPAGGPVRAAGGLVVRDERVLLVHRPRFDDWSLPKGKLKRGEHPLAGAVREVREETGVVGRPGMRLPTASYEVWSAGALVPKLVDYWVMSVAESSRFEPADEVDEIAWMGVADALAILSYPRDIRVVRAFSELPTLRAPVVLLRHAHVGDEDSWSGPDETRPLDTVGAEQAAALAGLLPLLGPRRLVSAQPRACRQTLADVAQVLGVQVEIDARFDEGADPDTAAAVLRGLATDAATVVCSQGGTIPAAIARLGGRPEPAHVVAMGDGLVLSFSGDTLVAADPFSPGVA